LLENNITPSLTIPKTNQEAKTNINVLYSSSKNSPLSLNTSSLDIINSANINFFFNITSNPQQNQLASTNYFSLINFLNTDYASSAVTEDIKFRY